MRLLAMLAALAWATAAFATDAVLSPPAADAWRVLDFPTIPRHTSYTVIHDGAFDAFKADADCSASARYLPLDHVDLTQTPQLRCPPPALAIPVMTDTDNTCQQATAYYADFRFLSR